jgi:hypothetical protein
MGWGERYGGKGFNTVKSNAGFGWAALKATGPGRMMGVDQLRGMGNVIKGMNTGNFMQSGRELGGMARRWGKGAGFMTPRMKRAAQVYRGGAVAGGVVGGIGAADFLNPWGLGWGD